MWVYQENGAYNLRQSLQITPRIIPLLHTHLTGSETKACGLCTDEQTGGESFHNMTALASPLECWSCKSLEVTQNLHVLYWKQQQHHMEISVHCKSTYTCTLYTIPVISWYVFISSIPVLEKSVNMLSGMFQQQYLPTCTLLCYNETYGKLRTGAVTCIFASSFWRASMFSWSLRKRSWRVLTINPRFQKLQLL